MIGGLSRQGQLELREAQASLPPELARLCGVVLDDPSFWDGYGARSHHHNYKGGLAVHTAEVVWHCLRACDGNPSLDRDVLLTAAIWHDYLKIRDYVIDAEGKIVYTPYKEQIYHIAGSFAEFYYHARSAGLEYSLIDSIGHCILAHHGRPDWGSAVTPKTPEALTLHYADCMSAWFEGGQYKEKT